VVIDINLPVTVIGSKLFVGCLNGIIVKKNLAVMTTSANSQI